MNIKLPDQALYLRKYGGVPPAPIRPVNIIVQIAVQLAMYADYRKAWGP